MSAPIRIQRRRTKGFTLPPNTVSVTRPGRWGNPYKVGDRILVVGGGYVTLNTAADAVALFRSKALDTVDGMMFFCADVRKELRGKNLACFCSLDQPCHADVLLEIANS